MLSAFVTTSTPMSRDGTHALIVSLWQHHPRLPVYVVAAEGAEVPLDVRHLAVADLARDVGLLVTDTLDPDNQALFSLPLALELVLSEHAGVAYAAPGCLVTNPLTELDEQLDQHPIVLVAPYLSQEIHTLTPGLHTLSRRRELLTERVLGVRDGASDELAYWREVVRESFFDTYQRRPGEVMHAALTMLLGGSRMGVAGERTFTTWVDFAAIASSRAIGPIPSVVSADQLLAVARESGSEDREDVEVAWQLLADNVHDSRPLEPLMALTTEAVERCPIDPDAVTPFHMFCREVRRASDPTGARWAEGDDAGFVRWLYERNHDGLTRIAHLYWRSRKDLWDGYLPKPTVDPEPLRRWAAERSLVEFGADLFDPSIPPRRLPKEKADHTDLEPASRAGRVARAVRWRLNLLEGLLPGYEARRKRRRFGADPGEKRGIAPPRRVPVERTPSVFGAPPRALSVIGCFRSESGLGQAARASLGAFQLLGRDFSYVDTSEMYPSRNSVDAKLSDRPFGAIGDVNLLHSNADELITLGDQVFRNRLAGRFNAAMWFWETADLPERSWPAFDFVDELWVASEYLADVFGQYGKVPVHTIGLAADLPAPREVHRSEFGLHDDDFVFLFVYDALSAHGRKNPEKALEAFIRAFGPDYRGVRFVLKVSNLNKFPASQKRIQGLVDCGPAIALIDEYFTRDRVMDLMQVADVYVSLHGAEGFGLTLLEAMALGTPTICTAYSGNMDFTTPENSWLVDYDMMATPSQTGPYPPGSVWASPNVDSAADLMRAARNDPAEVQRKRERAIVDARHAASLDRYAERLDAQLRRVL